MKYLHIIRAKILWMTILLIKVFARVVINERYVGLNNFFSNFLFLINFKTY